MGLGELQRTLTVPAPVSAAGRTGSAASSHSRRDEGASPNTTPAKPKIKLPLKPKKLVDIEKELGLRGGFISIDAARLDAFNWDPDPLRLGSATDRVTKGELYVGPYTCS
eukprot:tig00020710_g13254.t1